ncbi:MAG: hypothetical protein ACRD68_06325 [Pyrinomonadaceae bacterium]
MTLARQFTLALAALASCWTTTPATPARPAPPEQGPEGRRSINLGEVPAEGNSVRDFVPPGWVVEDQAGGDLDRDSKPDIVLKLVEGQPHSADGVTNERGRALIVLLTTGGGRLRRAAASGRLLYCVGCAGVLEDPAGSNVSVKIENGVIVLEQMRGSREAVTSTLRFRHDPRAGRFLLIGEEVENRDRFTGRNVHESSNYLTGVKIVRISQYDKRSDREVAVSVRKGRVASSKRFLEDVDGESY